jgi:prephenate dehydrogenase
MGSSLAAALIHAGWRVYLHHRRPEVSAAAQKLGYGIQIEDPRRVANEIQMAVVCTPVGVIGEWVRRFATELPQAVITDVGSVKGPVCRELADLAAAGRFVGSHPMAGSHRQGLANADPQLYRERLVVVTPVPGTPERSLTMIEDLWRMVGSRVMRMDPEAHDRAVAQVSHLPHILAGVAASGLSDAAAPVASTGFRDTTRVAGGNPELWADILRHNRVAVLAEMKSAAERAQRIIDALERDDETAIRAWLAAARNGRRRFERCSFTRTGDADGGQ